MPALSPTAYTQAFCARVQEARLARDLTQAQVAEALDIPVERYKKYENRTPIPHRFMERFCTIVGRDIEYLVTGKVSSHSAAPRPRRRRKAPIAS